MAKNRAPQNVIRCLEEALRIAKMESFGMLGSITTDRGEQMPAATFIKDRTLPYRTSWLIPEIETALAWAKGEDRP